MLQPKLHPWSLRAIQICRSSSSRTFPRAAWYATANYAPPPPNASSSLSPSNKSNQGSSPVLRSYKPRTPGVRHLKRPINDHLWKGRPFKPLTLPKKGQAKGGRNVTGHITVRHRGGGHKRRLRIVDFDRWSAGPHIVERIEYDPNRSAHIALLTEQATGKKSYIIAADGMRAGDVIQSYRAGLPKDLLDSMGGVIDPGILASKTAWRGNCLPLHMVPVGTTIFNVGSRGNAGAVFCRSAGTFAVVVSKDSSTAKKQKQQEQQAAGRFGENDSNSSSSTPSRNKDDSYIHVKLQSGEVRKVNRDACCTIGVASNVHYNKRQLGKAGRSRWLNIRPTVRGVAMNKVDHPHGGGRGKSKSNRIPTSPWGTLAKSGYKTRRKHKVNKFLVTPRPRNLGRDKKENEAAAWIADGAAAAGGGRLSLAACTEGRGAVGGCARVPAGIGVQTLFQLAVAVGFGRVIANAVGKITARRQGTHMFSVSSHVSVFVLQQLLEQTFGVPATLPQTGPGSQLPPHVQVLSQFAYEQAPSEPVLHLFSMES
ncbi:50S ribosomal protein l2 [Zalerion maritima]|uniref:Large ribosomal subunit protein uL2m n=1 Tax=Zalerion maritima TaxID=339359 RepID=A0AAD5WWJ9_9PEZI|nr:50S ribosomal protein l2 [Zalerion maritima]